MTENTTFTSVIEWLDKAEDKSVLVKKIKDKQKPLEYNTFYQVGLLARLLIAGDLAYAGVIPKPTIEEMGRMIALVNKGALNGLARLGLLNLPNKGTKLSKEEVTVAFKVVHEYLTNNLTQEEQDNMGMDPIVIEHSLCKLTRVSHLL